ncbi:MAG: DUF4838 domain-containing protein [Aquificota bacterium]|nr:MAG: DUF4838 domain-containing protein [Aquificota bacterium]
MPVNGIYTEKRWIADEINKYISMMGFFLPVFPIDNVPEEGGLILSTCKERCFGYSLEHLNREGFLVRNKNGNVYILSKSDEGLLYGAYEFLELLGFRFLTKSETYVPKKINKTDFTKTVNPRFLYREVFMAESDCPDFAQRLRLNGRLGHREERPLKVGNVYILIVSLDDLVPEDRYQESDPEYFCGGQLDFTNPEVIEIAKLNMDRILSRHRDLENLHVLISTNDTGFYCNEGRSKERIEEAGAPSAPYLDFVVQIADSMRDIYPNVKFLALAYLWSRKPPEVYRKLPDNVGVFYSLIDADLSIPLLVRSNTRFLKEIYRWGEISNYIFIWHYITNFSNYLVPFPDIYQIADDIKTLSKIPQIKGIFLQGAYNTYGSDLSDLKLYVFSKLLWNPDLDVDNLIEDFSSHYYGNSGKIVEAYVNATYSYIKEHAVSLKVKTNPDYFDKDFLKRMYSLLSFAQENAENEKIRERIEKVKVGIDTAILLNSQLFDDRNFLEKVKKELVSAVEKYTIEKYSESGDIEDILNINVSVKDTPPPETKGLIKEIDWLDFQEFSLKLCCADIVEDRYASNEKAVAMEGEKTDWGIQFSLENLPPGKWKIYFVIRVQLKDDIDFENKIAFRYGVYPVTDDYEAPLEDFADGDYHTVYVGTFEKSEDTDLWIAPPGEDYVEYILVDRVFVIKSR